MLASRAHPRHRERQLVEDMPLRLLVDAHARDGWRTWFRARAHGGGLPQPGTQGRHVDRRGRRTECRRAHSLREEDGQRATEPKRIRRCHGRSPGKVHGVRREWRRQGSRACRAAICLAQSHAPRLAYAFCATLSWNTIQSCIIPEEDGLGGGYIVAAGDASCRRGPGSAEAEALEGGACDPSHRLEPAAAADVRRDRRALVGRRRALQDPRLPAARPGSRLRAARHRRRPCSGRTRRSR